MSLIKMDKVQQKTLMIFTVVGILAGFIFLQDYLMLIIFSAIMAVLFNPIYEWFLKKGKSSGAASMYTFFISMLVIIIPLVIVGILTFNQIETIVRTVEERNYNINLEEVGNDIVDTANSTLESAGVSYRLSVDEVTDTVTKAASAFGKSVFTSTIRTFSGIFGMITAFLIYVYVFLSMLKNQKVILQTLRRLNPFGDEVGEIYRRRIQSMTKATVAGQFTIAFMQGLESAAVISLVGPSNLFFFLLVSLTVLSVVPLGAGIVTIPIGIIMILTGNVSGGVIVIANHLLIVTNIDNIMRPKLVPKDARLDPALMMLAVFAGLGLFGFLGIVIGPVIMILLVTTLQLYLEVFYSEEEIDKSKQKKKPSYYAKLKGKLAGSTKKAKA